MQNDEHWFADVYFKDHPERFCIHVDVVSFEKLIDKINEIFFYNINVDHFVIYNENNKHRKFKNLQDLKKLIIFS